MSQVYDALRKAEQIHKNLTQAAEDPDAVDFSTPYYVAPTGNMHAYLGPSLRVRGEITGDEPLQIDGNVEGIISIGDYRLTVGQTAHVSANITAGEVVVFGELDGQVCASERIVINEDAYVSGELTTPRIMIEEGAFIKANVQVRNDAPPGAFPSIPTNY